MDNWNQLHCGDSADGSVKTHVSTKYLFQGFYLSLGIGEGINIFCRMTLMVSK